MGDSEGEAVLRKQMWDMWRKEGSERDHLSTDHGGQEPSANGGKEPSHEELFVQEMMLRHSSGTLEL